MRIFAALVFVLFSASPRASAGELAYQWTPNEVMHYRIQAFVVAPSVLRFMAARNVTARAEDIALAMELDCKVDPPQKRTQSWRCSTHRVELGGKAWEGEQEKLDAILAEYMEQLKEATIVVDYTPTGRIQLVDVEGLSRNSDREKLIHEYLRLLLQRAFAALEIELPKNGEVPAGTWRQKGNPLSMRLPTRYGTAGGVRLNHEVVGREGDLLVINSVGRGTVHPGSALESGADRGVNMSVTSTALFDPTRGLLVRNEVQTNGALTTSASMASAGFYLNQVVLVELLESWEEETPVEEAPAEEAPAEEAPAEEAPAEEAPAEETAEEPPPSEPAPPTDR
jgi:hypothetical protein